MRGIADSDSNRCPLVLDDMAVASRFHFPCIIYMREGGDPIGKIGGNSRIERHKWFVKTDVKKDKICRKQCLEICRKYNNLACSKNQFVKQALKEQ